jgi:outer membrane immunogenic protein
VRFKLKSVVGAAMSLGAAQIAFAADFPARTPYYAPPPMYMAQTWTGCYGGGNIGVGRSNTDVNDEISGVSLAKLNSTAFVGGGQIGCDYQFSSNWVIGVQGMFDGSTFKSDATSASLAPGFLHGSIPWFATATGRLGYALGPDWLVYGKAGGAWTHTDASILVAGVNVSSGSFGQSGWTAGGGAEWRFAHNWSLFVEYDYLGFTDKTVTLTGLATNIGAVHQNLQIGLVGVNYRY